MGQEPLSSRPLPSAPPESGGPIQTAPHIEGVWPLAKPDPKVKKKAPAKAEKPKSAAKSGASKSGAKKPTGGAKKAAAPKPAKVTKSAAKAAEKPAAAPVKKSAAAPAVSVTPGRIEARKPEAGKPNMSTKGKPLGSGKEGITIKVPMKKPVPPPPKNIPQALLPKSKGGSSAGAPAAVPAGEKGKFRIPFANDFTDGKAAAAKLFAAAGLGGLKHVKVPTIEDEMAAKPLTKSPLTKTQLKEFREVLLTKRAELSGDVHSMETEALMGGSGSLSNLPQHMAEQGTDTFDQTMALNIAATKRGVMRDIDSALTRIDDNTYGICQILGKPIEVARLQAEPWTKYCIEGARHKERASMLR